MNEYIIATSEPYYGWDFIKSDSFIKFINIFYDLLQLCINKNINKRHSIKSFYKYINELHIIDENDNNYIVYYDKKVIQIKYYNINSYLEWFINIFKTDNMIKILFTFNCNTQLSFIIIPNMYIFVRLNINNFHLFNNKYIFNIHINKDDLYKICYNMINYYTQDNIKQYYEFVIKHEYIEF